MADKTTESVEQALKECLAELREMFPAHEYIRIHIGCSWFGDSATDTLTRIVVTRYEWSGVTLNEAMDQVRQWHAERAKKES